MGVFCVNIPSYRIKKASFHFILDGYNSLYIFIFNARMVVWLCVAQQRMRKKTFIRMSFVNSVAQAVVNVRLVCNDITSQFRRIAKIENTLNFAHSISNSLHKFCEWNVIRIPIVVELFCLIWLEFVPIPIRIQL